MATREILTLQFGHYSNYVGAHFWNIQELSFDYTGTVKTECNHDILYREGTTPTGEATYTPRLLVADLKGSLKTLPATGGLPVDPENTTLEWYNVEKIEEPVAPKNKYLQDIDGEGSSNIEENEYKLDEEVNTWTDYLYPRLHTRTINIVKDYSHGNENERYDIFHKGTEQWKSDFGDEFSENIRKYIEECNSIQGFDVNFDSTDGFAGLALGCIEHLVDEYNKPIVVHPIIASYFADNDPSTQEERDISNLNDSIRLVNFALSVEKLSEHATFFVPLCTGEKGWRKPGNPRTFEHVNYSPQLYYQSSALLASALDTLSLKYRHKSNFFSISDICADLTGYGRKMAAATLGIPLALNESEYLIEFLNNTTKPIYTNITPSCKVATDKLFQLITVRGIPEHYLKAPTNRKESKEQSGMPAYACKNVKEMFNLYFQANNFLSATDVSIFDKPLTVKTPYPRIFSDNLTSDGFVRNDSSMNKVASCPVVAGYHNGNFMADMIEKLHREVGRIKFSKLHKFREEGLEETDYNECMNRIAEFKDNYEDDFEL